MPDSHNASNRPTVLVGNAQPSPVATSSSPPVVVSQNAQSSRVPLIHASPEQLTGITMKIYDLLKVSGLFCVFASVVSIASTIFTATKSRST